MSNERPWNAQDKRRLQDLAAMQPIELAKLCLATEIKLDRRSNLLRHALLFAEEQGYGDVRLFEDISKELEPPK